LSAFIEINKIHAFVLFDSGSTADAISPDFARLAKLKICQLENPVTLQLGTKGSKSKINYGCYAPYKIQTKNAEVRNRDYWDIANIDRYNAVVGTVFMRNHDINLRFEDDRITMKGKDIPCLSKGEE
ncbi:hypothetical protein L218DRAFT_822596, partial [Marasmius fiardii PR-910]